MTGLAILEMALKLLSPVHLALPNADTSEATDGSRSSSSPDPKQAQ
jgi:hypothetical protein